MTIEEVLRRGSNSFPNKKRQLKFLRLIMGKEGWERLTLKDGCRQEDPNKAASNGQMGGEKDKEGS